MGELAHWGRVSECVGCDAVSAFTRWATSALLASAGLRALCFTSGLADSVLSWGQRVDAWRWVSELLGVGLACASSAASSVRSCASWASSWAASLAGWLGAVVGVSSCASCVGSSVIGAVFAAFMLFVGMGGIELGRGLLGVECVGDMGAIGHLGEILVLAIWLSWRRVWECGWGKVARARAALTRCSRCATVVFTWSSSGMAVVSRGLLWLLRPSCSLGILA